MSTLRISNIEAKSVPASATIDEKVKITSSSGDTLVFIDGKTSGITTVGINTTDPNITFDANSNVVVTGIITATKFSGAFEPTSVGIADSIFHTGDTDTSINFPAADTITLDTAGSQRVRINANGYILIGTDSSRITRLATNNFSPKMQLEDDTEAAFSMSRFINSAGPPRFVLQKARGTGASPVVVSNNDDIGQILFSGWDGDTFTNGAEIIAEVDGTPGDDVMPGRLIFKTNTGGTTNTERLRIDHSGNVYFSGSQSGNNRGIIYNHASGFGIYASADSGTNRDIRFYSNSASTSERLRVGAAGSVTHYCGSSNSDGFFVMGNASQGRTTFAVRAGNTDSNATSSFRLQHANGTSVGSLSLTHNSNNFNMMNAVQGGQIIFHTNESGSSLPKMRIHPDGDVQITSGNLVVPSGNGIDFSATSDASGMTDELLDDYEEGSWTPTYDTSASSGSITVNAYSLQYGKYVKIGKMVFVEGVLRANVTNNSNGTYDIGGLPFTVANTTNASGIIHGKEQSAWTVAPDHFSCIANNTRARARGGFTIGASSYTNGNTSGFNSGSTNNNRVYIVGCYRAEG